MSPASRPYKATMSEVSTRSEFVPSACGLLLPPTKRAIPFGRPRQARASKSPPYGRWQACAPPTGPRTPLASIRLLSSQVAAATNPIQGPPRSAPCSRRQDLVQISKGRATSANGPQAWAPSLQSRTGRHSGGVGSARSAPGDSGPNRVIRYRRLRGPPSLSKAQRPGRIGRWDHSRP